MTYEHAFMLAMVALQLGMFIIGSFILPSIRATNTAVCNNTNELHAVKVQLATMETRLSGIEALRANLHGLRNDLHAMQLKMAEHGLLGPLEAHPGKSGVIS